ncbi:LDL receptor repeat-containing protein egg-1-like [Centruroides vittatus]|uniref:LDL receptor repeat-containing protein egg-1-like n=1 Tax=Centruroides vittatus TaxID=120091 RepID=UPI00350F4652
MTDAHHINIYIHHARRIAEIKNDGNEDLLLALTYSMDNQMWRIMNEVIYLKKENTFENLSYFAHHFTIVPLPHNNVKEISMNISFCNDQACRKLNNTSCQEICNGDVPLKCNGTMCVRDKECPCVINGIVYPPGNHYTNDCKNVTCINKKLSITDISCKNIICKEGEEGKLNRETCECTCKCKNNNTKCIRKDGNETCIEKYEICDNETDCADGSDESCCPGLSESR